MLCKMLTFWEINLAMCLPRLSQDSSEQIKTIRLYNKIKKLIHIFPKMSCSSHKEIKYDFCFLLYLC